MEFSKGRSSKFCEGSRVRQTPEEWRGDIDRNVVEITIKAIVQKPLMIKKEHRFVIKVILKV